MIRQTAMRLTGRQLEVIARVTSGGRVLYDLQMQNASGLDIKTMQEVLGEMISDIYELAYVSVNGEAHCSPTIERFEEAHKDARGAFAD